MSKWPSLGYVAPLIVSPYFMYPYSSDININNSGNASGGWLTNNLAHYFPVWIPHTWVATKLWWQNGATATGNVDCGIYDEAGNRLISTGSTAQSGTNAVQSVDITDTTIPAGTVYLAIAHSSTSGTFWGCASGVDPAGYVSGGYVQTSALPLPATATFASSVTGMRFPKFGALRSPRTVL